MKKWWIAPALALALVTAVVLVSGCGPTEQPAPSDPSTGQVGDVDPTFIQAVDTFGLSLLSNLDTESTENIVVSPVSVHDSLSMVSNGASGDTAQQMTEVLGILTYGTGNVNQQWANVITTLNSDENAEDNESAGKLDIANALWYQDGLVPTDEFLDTVSVYYGAQIGEVDFGAKDATKTINEWVSANTNDMIEEIVSEDDLSSDTVMSLTNTVYFASDWREPFDEGLTKDEHFTRRDGSTVSVPMMNSTGSFAYFEDENAQAVKMPYADGKTALYVVLPREGATTKSVLDNLGGDGFSVLMSETAKEEANRTVSLALPRVDTQYETDLTGTLKGMGMVNAFDPQAAEFTGLFTEMGEAPIYLGPVSHAVRLVIDENGTEAAAASNVEAETTAAPSTEPVVMRCDRPFVLVLADEDTGAALFAGVIVDPEK